MQVILNLDGSVKLFRGEKVYRGQQNSKQIDVCWETAPPINAERLAVQICIVRPDGEQSGWQPMLRKVVEDKIHYFYTMQNWDTQVSGTAQAQIRWYELNQTNGSVYKEWSNYTVENSAIVTFIVGNGVIAQPAPISNENYNAMIEAEAERQSEELERQGNERERTATFNDGERARENEFGSLKGQLQDVISNTGKFREQVENKLVANSMPPQVLDLFSNDTYGFSVTTTPNQWQGGIELDIPAEYNAIVRINLENGATNPRAIALTNTNAVPNATNTIAEFENPNNRAVSLTTFINADEQAQKFYVFGKWLSAGTGKIIVSVTLMEQLFKTFITSDNKQVILADGKKLKVLKGD